MTTAPTKPTPETARVIIPVIRTGTRCDRRGRPHRSNPGEFGAQGCQKPTGHAATLFASGEQHECGVRPPAVARDWIGALIDDAHKAQRPAPAPIKTVAVPSSFAADSLYTGMQCGACSWPLLHSHAGRCPLCEPGPRGSSGSSFGAPASAKRAGGAL